MRSAPTQAGGGGGGGVQTRETTFSVYTNYNQQQQLLPKARATAERNAEMLMLQLDQCRAEKQTVERNTELLNSLPNCGKVGRLPTNGLP